MACPDNEPLAVTQPHYVQAVTLSTVTGACNVHLDDGLDVVYKVQPGEKGQNTVIQNMITSIATAAYTTGTKVSITYEGGADIGAPYCQRWMKRITLEGKHGLIPWEHREQ